MEGKTDGKRRESIKDLRQLLREFSHVERLVGREAVACLGAYKVINISKFSCDLFQIKTW